MKFFNWPRLFYVPMGMEPVNLSLKSSDGAGPLVLLSPISFIIVAERFLDL